MVKTVKALSLSFPLFMAAVLNYCTVEVGRWNISQEYGEKLFTDCY